MPDKSQAEQTHPLGVVITRANPLAPDPRVMKMARALRLQGYAVTLVGWNLAGNLPGFEVLDGFPCYRLAVHAKFGRGMINLIHQIRWQLALVVWLIQHRQQYAIVHACDFDTVLAALCSKAFLGKQVVYDIFDFYADMLRATPGWVRCVIRSIDRWAIQAADALILADDSRYAQIGKARPKQSAVIYNALEDTALPPPPQDSGRTPAAGLRLAYFGNLQVERGLLVLLEVLREHPEWQLDLGGFGGDEALIQAKASLLTNVTWHGLVPYEQVLNLTRCADVLLATYDPSIPNNRFASPNKLFEAMLLGKPIIVAQNTNMDRIVNESACGVVVPYGSPAHLSAALSMLETQPDLRQQMGNNARKAFETTYNWQAMQKRLRSLYNGLKARQ